jgi:hypothetical protein
MAKNTRQIGPILGQLPLQNLAPLRLGAQTAVDLFVDDFPGPVLRGLRDMLPGIAAGVVLG